MLSETGLGEHQIFSMVNGANHADERPSALADEQLMAVRVQYKTGKLVRSLMAMQFVPEQNRALPKSLLELSAAIETLRDLIMPAFPEKNLSMAIVSEPHDRKQASPAQAGHLILRECGKRLEAACADEAVTAAHAPALEALKAALASVTEDFLQAERVTRGEERSRAMRPDIFPNHWNQTEQAFRYDY